MFLINRLHVTHTNGSAESRERSPPPPPPPPSQPTILETPSLGENVNAVADVVKVFGRGCGSDLSI
jgi:hypothetical protein